MEKFTEAHTGATRIVHKIPIFGSSSGGCLQRITVEKCLKNNVFKITQKPSARLYSCVIINR